MTSPYRSLPSVQQVLESPSLTVWREELPHEVLVALAREVLEEARTAISSGGQAGSLAQLAGQAAVRAKALTRPSLRPVLNATGVVLHTNLGRAPLSEAAREAVAAAARGYSNLELELESGERGARHLHVETLLRRLTGAEAAMAVNNNAAALLLVLSALAAGREVIVSRGQAVEIGGGFRIPEVLRQSGARLIEVGTTNRTYASDYAEAITDETAALLRVHPSNFQIIGFTASATLEELVALGRERGVVVLDDVGSGCLLDTEALGLGREPRVQDSVAAGADLVTFSGDKLLGGPQAGLIVGRKALLERLRGHPLARAVRLDKLGLAALEATLRHYLRGEALEAVPIWRMLSTPLETLERRARCWAEELGETAQVGAARSAVGGGSLPGVTLPTWCLLLGQRSNGGPWAQRLAAALRSGEPPVLARIEQNTVLLDPRTVLPEEDEALIAACRRALTRL